MELFVYIFLFLIGTAIGSFVNVVVERTARSESIQGRSYCEACNKRLTIKDLIPIISYLTQKGQCRYCKHALSKQYLLVELIFGLAFMGIYYLVSHDMYTLFEINGNLLHLVPSLLPYASILVTVCFLIITSSLLALFLSDYKYGMLYDNITVPTIIFVFIYKLSTTIYILWHYYNQLKTEQFGSYLVDAGFFASKVQFALMPFIYTLSGSFGIALFFLLLIIVTKGRGIGGGDVKLGLLIGLIAGWPYMIAAIMIGFLTGSLYSLILILIRRKKVGRAIPFGPFLIIGCLAVMFFGNNIINWYIVSVLGLESLY